MIMKKSLGFTLIEVLLSVALIALLAGIGVPIYQSFQNRNSLDVAAVVLVNSLYRAEVLARGVDGDSTWGVYVAASNITIFKGASYAARDTTFDEFFDTTNGITVTGTQEYIFSKFTGYPVATGSTILTSTNNETRTIAINAKGTISY
ncbi:MAG: prepilin-type N-terminal cleavage/methylation domain-containing protein [Candidatus Falkowbacteria bacterium]|nr:prepilin-type N-terminal cleavage/methylation domain-containing protein [Candidatus Falkowbacteria bacterium]